MLKFNVLTKEKGDKIEAGQKYSFQQ